MSQRTSIKEVFPSIGHDLGKKEKQPGKGRGAGEGKTKRQSEAHKPNAATTQPTAQQKRLSLPVAHGRPSSPSVPSIVVLREKGSKHEAEGRSSSLERKSLAVPDGGAATTGRRFSDGKKPEDGSLTVPAQHKRSPQSSSLTLDRMQHSPSNSCLRLSKDDLANLRAINTSPKNVEDKVDVAKIHLELKIEFDVEKSFQASYRERPETAGISSLVSLNPFMSLAGASAAPDKEYLPLGATELKELWRIQAAGEGRGEIRAIRGMCFTGSGQLAVTEEKNSRVQIFNANDGQSLRVLRETSTIRRMQPAGIALIPDKPILAVADLNRVVFLDHEFKGQWSTEVIIKNKTNLTGVAAINRGAIVLTDIGIKPSVGLYEPDGRVIREFQTDFERPQGVTVSHELGITFVSDSTVGCVYLYDYDGRLISKIGHSGCDLVRLVYPQGMCCLSSGTCLLVADRAQHRLVVYDLRNHAVDHLLTADDKLFSPLCLASGGNKYLAVSEENQDFKVNDYELKMYRMRRGNRKS